ncbi:MAG: GNAT family N-acetyltransferase [Verrucomicrobia bacterium]|nr:GNAT family N-acetyltransferase [Verrucomicrobiota bacterium]MDE3099165.1 GNAT family N-acetyltransferase [Verrucomicrobiota bacterium]
MKPAPVLLLAAPPAQYTVRLAAGAADIRAAQALRFEVFNVEMDEGLQESRATGLDADCFDAVCDHLLVEHLPSQQVAGTYRLQTGAAAAANLGYYSAQEFHLEEFEPLRRCAVEAGRACIHRDHRHITVLGLLWKGIANYAQRHGARFLFGCSSLTSQDPVAGASVYAELCRNHLSPMPWRARPRAEYDCPLHSLSQEPQKIPKLLQAYLAIGAKICGPPALDWRFKTIDFLTMLDLQAMPPLVRRRFLD